MQPTPAPRFSDGAAPAAAFVPGPIAAAGAHTREVLTSFGLEDVDALLADGVVSRELADGRGPSPVV
jgi:alpha-methylacyl-CoA racemase